MTGPVASNYAPVVEAMKAYLEHVNGRGGINGRKVRVVVLDDQAQPSRAASNAKQLVEQDKVAMLLNVSLSSTYAPMIAESKRAGVPLYFAGAVCPRKRIRRPTRCSSARPHSARTSTRRPRSPS